MALIAMVFSRSEYPRAHLIQLKGGNNLWPNIG